MSAEESIRGAMPLRLLMLGFGRMGRAVAAELVRRGALTSDRNPAGIQVIGILTRTNGCVVDGGGIDLPRLLEGSEGTGRLLSSAPVNVADAVASAPYDVLLDLSTFSFDAKGEPAVSYVREALRRSKHVVTADKGPAAFSFRELERIASESGRRFHYASPLMGGLPIVEMVREAVRGKRISTLSGVLSPSATYVLEQMEDQVPKEEAIAAACDLGLMQTDPSLDAEGKDAAATAAILANALMGGSLTPADIPSRSFARLAYTHIHKALSKGKTHKLITRVWREGEVIKAGVSPELIDVNDPWASVGGTTVALRVEPEGCAPVEFRLAETTLDGIARAVADDVVSLCRK